MLTIEPNMVKHCEYALQFLLNTCLFGVRSLSHLTTYHSNTGVSIRSNQIRAGDSWHSSKIIRADEKNVGFI